MGKILILDNIAKEVLSSNREFTLFGQRDYSLGKFGNYDFIFDFMQGIPLERLKVDTGSRKPYLIVPVFSSSLSPDQAVLRMNETHKQVPLIDCFALRDNASRNHTQFGMREERLGPFFDFYHLSKLPFGTDISSNSSYFNVDEDTLKNNLPARAVFEADLLVKRANIAQIYKGR